MNYAENDDRVRKVYVEEREREEGEKVRRKQKNIK
jgi:hypothetical protein